MPNVLELVNAGRTKPVLDDIPATLRLHADKLERGEATAYRGVLVLRQDDNRLTVIGLGSEARHELAIVDLQAAALMMLLGGEA
jgi:hypothetical protein